MQRRILLLSAAAGALVGCATVMRKPDRAELVGQVTASETAFAKTMADRDLAAFASFVADDAVFLNGGRPLRGKAAIVEHWKRFYAEREAPFSWRPDAVEVLESGSLAQSIGPVAGPDGTVFARFYSTWRREAAGTWRIVLDNGYEACACPKA